MYARHYLEQRRLPPRSTQQLLILFTFHPDSPIDAITHNFIHLSSGPGPPSRNKASFLFFHFGHPRSLSGHQSTTCSQRNVSLCRPSPYTDRTNNTARGKQASFINERTLNTLTPLSLYHEKVRPLQVQHFRSFDTQFNLAGRYAACLPACQSSCQELKHKQTSNSSVIHDG